MLRPAVLFAPEIIAVYAPGLSVAISAESALFAANGNAPSRAAVAVIAGAFTVVQPVLLAILRLSLSNNVRTGALRLPARPNEPESVGPAARTSTCLGRSPVTTNP